MRNVFPGEFRPTNEEFEDLWSQGLIVPDANVLLDPYRISRETADALLAILESFTDRVRIPYQFAREFARNRMELLVKDVATYRNRAESLDRLIQELRVPRGHPFLSEDHIVNLERVRDALKEEARAHREKMNEDPFLERIFGLAESRMSSAPDVAAIVAWTAEAQRRNAAKIPPGYKDDKKDEPECWGDFFGWQEMIALAKLEKKPLMFITGDAKEDWWWKSGGETIGPRRELLAEFMRETGTLFYMYSTNRFVELASKRLNRELPPEAVAELAEAREPLRRDDEKATIPQEVVVGADLLEGPPKASQARHEAPGDDIHEAPLVELEKATSAPVAAKDE